MLDMAYQTFMSAIFRWFSGGMSWPIATASVSLAIEPSAQEDSLGDSFEVKPPAASHGRRPYIAEAEASAKFPELPDSSDVRNFWKADQDMVCLHILIIYISIHQYTSLGCPRKLVSGP